MVRVLHMLDGLDRGGIETMLMHLYRNMDRNMVQFDFLLTNPDHCEYEVEVLRLGGKIFRVPRLSFVKPWEYLNALNSFIETHKEYQIIHSHSTAKSFFPLNIAKKHGVENRIAHSHINKERTWILEIVQNILKPKLLKVCTHKFACSEDAAVWLYGMKGAKDAHIVFNAINVESNVFNPIVRVKLRESLCINEHEVVYGHIGRYTEQKNHMFLLEVFKEILGEDKNAKLILIGKGPLQKKVNKRIEELGINDSVIQTGEIDNVNEYIQAMDIFLFPSLFEGLGMVLIEAQVSGLKCYTSKDKVPTCADVTGLIKFISLDLSAEKWANIIRNDFNKSYERKSHIQEVCNAGFDIKQSAKEMQDFYLSLKQY